MKKLIFILAMVFTFSAAFTSCRDTKKDTIELNTDDVDDVADDIEDAMDDIEDAQDDVEDAIEDAADDN